MSGPYRVSADLRSGAIEEARPPRGAHGDGARLDATSMPATRRRTLTPAAAGRIRALAGTVWRDGAGVRRACPPTVDALVQFRITLGGGTRDFDAPVPCLTEDARRLRAALLCGMDPAAASCPAE